MHQLPISNSQLPKPPVRSIWVKITPNGDVVPTVSPLVGALTLGVGSWMLGVEQVLTSSR
jgi:hypothetical protein